MVTHLDGPVQTDHVDWNLVDLDLAGLDLSLDTNQVLMAVHGLRTIVCPVGNLALLGKLVDRQHPLVACLDTKHVLEQMLALAMKQA